MTTGENLEAAMVRIKARLDTLPIDLFWAIVAIVDSVGR
jgi:hypothetical protein